MSTSVRYILAVFFGATLLDLPSASSQTGGPTTESICNFGMGKNERTQSCEVPVPGGCVVAHFPGTNKPWSNISKGGATTCRFDEKRTDWKTRITGTCGMCKTEHCSARFSVMFECGLPPPTQDPRARNPSPAPR